MFDFTRVKFLGMPPERQHKKCAELLRALYDTAGEELAASLWEQYLMWREWMELAPCQSSAKKNVADLFHWHWQQAGQHLKEHRLLPAIKTQDRSVAEPIWPIAIYLDRIRSAHNVGSILRTTEAYALGTVHFAPQTPYVDHKQVQDASMGTSQWVRCCIQSSLDSLPRPLIALETSEKAISLHEFVFPNSFSLIVGNEEYGCSDEVLHEADYLVEIPLRGRKNSLNVANAFAIAAAEIARQRRFLPLVRSSCQ